MHQSTLDSGTTRSPRAAETVAGARRGVSMRTSPLDFSLLKENIRFKHSTSIPNKRRPGSSQFRRLVISSLGSVGGIADRLAARDVESVVKRIERIRRHKDTTVFERHAALLPVVSLTDSEIAELKESCGKLLEHSSPERSTASYASGEILRLSVDDPLIHSLLRESRLFSSDYLDFDPYFVFPLLSSRISLDDASTETHGLWSGLLKISQLPPNVLGPPGGVAWYLESNFTLLSTSLSHNDLSFLSARYLCTALTLRLTGNGLYYLAKLWQSYVDLARQWISREEDECVIEWQNLNDCFGNLPAGVSRLLFAPPSWLGDVAAQLICQGRIVQVPKLFRVFFSVPTVDFELSGADAAFSTVITYTRSLEKRCMDEKEFRKIEKWLSDRDNLVTNTVFDDQSLWPDYCVLASEVMERHSRGLSSPDGLDLSINLISALHSQSAHANALATFLVSDLAGMDRYCKTSINHGLRNPISADLIVNVQEVAGTSSLQLFNNVPYLRRFRINGEIFITSDGLPEPGGLIENRSSSILYDISVDTMVLNGSMVIWLRVDGREAPVDLRPHIPVLAEEYERDVLPSYVAAVRVGHIYHFTCVENGASIARYTDEVGDYHLSDVFFVLILRHDPSDQIRRRHGTLEWLRFWPEKDPKYCVASDSAKDDDRHLESLLNGYRREELRLENPIFKGAGEG